jgi:hypothetical protein
MKEWMQRVLLQLHEHKPRVWNRTQIIVEPFFLRFYQMPDDTTEIHIGTEEDRDVGLYSLEVAVIHSVTGYQPGPHIKHLDSEDITYLTQIIKLIV